MHLVFGKDYEVEELPKGTYRSRIWSWLGEEGLSFMNFDLLYDF